VTTTNGDGVYGPGHGCVFNVSGTDDSISHSWVGGADQSSDLLTDSNSMRMEPSGASPSISKEWENCGTEDAKPLPVRLGRVHVRPRSD
jgi:hypothetical protein